MATDESAFYGAVLPPDEPPLSHDTVTGAQVALLDTIAVVLGTFEHEIAVVSRRAFDERSEEAVVWGDSGRRSMRAAITSNGAALRCYDFNDLYVSPNGQGGHPSDVIPGLVAVAETRHRSGADLLSAILMAYDDIVRLMDLANVTAAGWDYANLVGLGAVRALAFLLDLDEDARRHASGIFGCSSLATNELESGALGPHGNLTSWKRFNGSTAVRRALESCQIAAAGAEAPFGSLMGREGFFRLQGVDPGELLNAAASQPRRSGISAAMFKRWPAGSRAQSAAIAAAKIHTRLPPGEVPISVNVRAHPEAVAHLVRPESFRPNSRETADHSLPYITCVALLRGRVEFADFDAPQSPERADVMRLLASTTVSSTEAASSGFATGCPTSVSAALPDGTVLTEDAATPPEKLSAIAMRDAVERKWATFAPRRLTAETADRARSRLMDLANVGDVGLITADLTAGRPLGKDKNE